MAPRDARITDRTRSMFRAILAEICIADTDDAILLQEVVMFFKLTRSHRIKLGRLGDFADCPVIIDDDDNEIRDTTTNIVCPVQLYSSSPPSPPSPTSVHSSSSSPLSLRGSPASSPPPPSMLSPRMSLRGASDVAVKVAAMVRHRAPGNVLTVPIYTGMDGPNKRKRKRKSVEDVNMDNPVGGNQQSVENIAQTSHPESLCADAEEATVLEGELPAATAPDAKDVSKEADLKCQITKSLEGGMPDILRPEDAIDVMTSVLLTAARIRIQVGKFGFEELVTQPFEVATGKIAKTGAGCAGIGLQKTWEEAFYWNIIKRHAATLESMPITRGPHNGFTPQEKVATAKFIDMVGVGTSDENQRRCRLWWKDLSDMQNAGVVCTLLYRNAKLNKYCKTLPERKHSSQQLIDTIVSWEKVYSSHIKQVELRALDRARGNYTGRLDLRHESVAGVLSIPDSSWDNGSDMWSYLALKAQSELVTDPGKELYMPNILLQSPFARMPKAVLTLIAAMPSIHVVNQEKLMTIPVWPSSVYSALVIVFQTRTVRSRDPDTTCLPSDKKAIDLIQSSRTVRSRDPDTTCLPSGEKAIDMTKSVFSQPDTVHRNLAGSLVTLLEFTEDLVVFRVFVFIRGEQNDRKSYLRGTRFFPLHQGEQGCATIFLPCFCVALFPSTLNPSRPSIYWLRHAESYELRRLGLLRLSLGVSASPQPAHNTRKNILLAPSLASPGLELARIGFEREKFCIAVTASATRFDVVGTLDSCVAFHQPLPLPSCLEFFSPSVPFLKSLVHNAHRVSNPAQRSSCDVLWTPDVIVNVVYRGVMIAVIAALVWQRYRRPGRIIDASTTGSNPQPQTKPNKTDTTAGEAADTQHTHVEDGGKANIKAEGAAHPKHTGLENRDKVHTKAEISVNTRHTGLEKGSKLDVIATAADVMNSFGEAAITL
ncbi:hypothetical protein B7494_g1269 [Chlorociboria aeruginascens]|nr:hypothetical protein B7494_g1269 [Chlorociboria aeruginascens]